MRRTLTTFLLAAILLMLAALPATAAFQRHLGTPDDDVMVGTNGPDRMDGRAGEDEISGRGARDALRGGFGRDALSGGDGPDYLLGSGVAGSGVNAHDNGDDSADTLRGGPGEDHMLGGLGADRLYGGHGADELHDDPAEFGTDRSVDVLFGGPGTTCSSRPTWWRSRTASGAGPASTAPTPTSGTRWPPTASAWRAPARPRRPGRGDKPAPSCILGTA